MRVLVAGDGGYVGAVLVPFLCTAGHEIDGLDLGVYEGCDLGPAPTDASARIPADVTDVTAESSTDRPMTTSRHRVSYGYAGSANCFRSALPVRCCAANTALGPWRQEPTPHILAIDAVVMSCSA